MTEKKAERVGDILCLFFALVAAFYPNSFWVNPFLLPVLFLSIHKGWKVYVGACIFLLGVSFLQSVDHGLEIGIVIGVYTFCEAALHFALPKEKSTMLGFFMMQVLFLLLILLKNLSLDNVKSWLIQFSFSTIFYRSLSQFFQRLEGRRKELSSSTLMVALSFIVTSFSIFWYPGQLITQILLWIVWICAKKHNASVAILTSFLFSLFVFDIGFYGYLFLYVPLFLMLFIRQEKLYPVVAIPLLFVTETPFYLNAHFYGMLITALCIYGFAKKYQEPLQGWVTEMIGQPSMIKKEKENGFLRLLQFSPLHQQPTPEEKMVEYVKIHVCKDCPHQSYCPIHENMAQYILDTSKKEKKFMNETCLTPYKFSLSIQQANKIFYDVNGYYHKWMALNEHYTNLFAAISETKEPLLQDELELERLKESRWGKFFQVRKNGFSLISKLSDEISLEEIEQICPSYRHERRRKNALLLEKQDDFVKKEPLRIEVGVVSKSLVDGVCGDSYTISQNQMYPRIALCDGMGHGENARDLSQYLLQVLQLEEECMTKGKGMIQLANDFMMLRKKESYATLDYALINPYTRVLKLWKAGSFPTYYLSKRNLQECKKSGLPIGILDHPSLEEYEFRLTSGDCFIFLTDGIKEQNVPFLPEKFLSLSTSNMSQMARDIYQICCPKGGYSDDVTIITLKVV